MITVTSNAANHIRKLLSSRDKKPVGVKLSIETKGCSGLSYSMEFVDCPDEKDVLIQKLLFFFSAQQWIMRRAC